MSDYDALLRPELHELSSYVPLEGTWPVRLDANEAPPLLSAAARRRLADALLDAAWERYPDARAAELRAALAARSGARPEQILVGTGSDEVIALLLTALDRPREGARRTAIVAPSPTFVMYRLSARARGLQVVEVPLDRDWDLDVGAMQRAIDFARPHVVFLASPNNPTGNRMSLDRIEAVARAASDALVVVDEAYVDYADGDQLALLAHPNVAVMRTLSKIGFAALRVGWLVGPEALVREVDKVRQPFNVPSPSQRLATVALTELGDEIARIVAAVRSERARVAAALARTGGVSVAPSDANFLWVETPGSAADVHRRLSEQGVLVRSFAHAGGRLARRLRITIGTPAENDRLLEVLPSCLG